MANRDLAAFHAIEAALLNSSRARGNGKPAYQSVARQFIYLWPGGKIDNLRKSLERHFTKHLADKMQEAREDEKEVTRGLNEIADEFINLCLCNAKDAREWALKTQQPRDMMFSSNAAAPGINLVSKLVQPETKKESQDSGFLKGYLSKAEDLYGNDKTGV